MAVGMLTLTMAIQANVPATATKLYRSPSFPSATALFPLLCHPVLDSVCLVLTSCKRSLLFLNEPGAFQGGSLYQFKYRINLNLCVLPALLSASPSQGITVFFHQ